VDPASVVLVYGSFYELRLPDASLDFAFMSQALHHADRPDALLGELRRVLRPGGVAIVIGEHVLSARHYAIYAAKAAAWLLPGRLRRRLPASPLARRPRLRPSGADLEPPDPVLGDHLYTRAEYRELFDRAGFDARRVRRAGSHYQSFVLTRR
jgi:SAM-dependent methyltransferase